MSDVKTTIAVYGSGAWGTALALVAERAGHRVILVGRDRGKMAMLRSNRQIDVFPGLTFPDGIEVTHDTDRLNDAPLVLLCAPAQATRLATRTINPCLANATVLMTCAKGIEQATGNLVAEVASEEFERGPIAVLSGPGFASEVASGLPTALTIAADDLPTAAGLAHILAAPGFRPYASTDPVGVQLGGALKNVLAIAAGIVAGRGLGASAQAAVITRGFVELRRLTAAWGGKSDTIMGLSGLGDLMLTCSSLQSRNYAFGHALGEGKDPASFGKLVEGAFTAAIAVQKAHGFGFEVPIIEAVAAVLAGRRSIDEAVDLLLARPLKAEDIG